MPDRAMCHWKISVVIIISPWQRLQKWNFIGLWRGAFCSYSILPSQFSLDHDNYYYAPRMAPHHHHNAHVPGISSHLDHGQSAAEHETPHERRRKNIMLAETIIRWYWVVLVVNYFIMILIIHRIYNNSISTIPEPCVRPLLSYTETLR